MYSFFRCYHKCPGVTVLFTGFLNGTTCHPIVNTILPHTMQSNVKSCQQCIFASMKVLMVCLGNICRSPLAEGILQHKVQLAGLHWEVNSAGTGNYHIGEPPHLLSQKVAMAHGIDISNHRARQFTANDMMAYDKIYIMDLDNYKAVKQISKKHFDAAKTAFIMNELFPGSNTEVPDPWFGTENDFITVYQMLDAATDSILQKYSS